LVVIVDVDAAELTSALVLTDSFVFYFVLCQAAPVLRVRVVSHWV